MYRPRKVYGAKPPFFRRLIKGIEKFNKLLSLRLLGKFLGVRQLDRKLSLDEIRSVLFIRYDALGDMVVTTPLWRILKSLKPSIKIGVAGSYKNLGVLQADTDVDVIYDYSATSLGDVLAKAKVARTDGWDLVVMCKFNQKTRGGIISRRSTANGFNVTVGTPNAEGHQALFSKLVGLPRSQHEMPMTEQLQCLLRGVIDLPDAQPVRPTLMIEPSAYQEALERINSSLSEKGKNKYILINVDAPEVRKWGLQKNLELAKVVESEYPDYVIFMISLPENEDAIKDAIIGSSLKNSKYFNTENFQYLLTLIRQAKLVVTPDTGIAHIASAESIPILGFYPEANEWLPYEIPYYIILPFKGEPIATIPLEVAAKGIRFCLDKLQTTTELGTTLIYLS
ncbi:MAG: glycosyltransferase family 9 protein [bacterium]